MYWKAIVSTLAAWFIGLLLDTNIEMPQLYGYGFLCLRVLFPILAMGICILRAIQRSKMNKGGDS